MKKKILLVLLMTFTFLSLFFVTNNNVVAVSSYYASAEGLTGHDLLEELAEITLVNHTTKTSYDSLKQHLQETDKDPNDPSKVLDFYSKISVKGSWDGSTWNREHVWPKSLSGGNYDNNRAGADVHHIRPTINKINSDRGNKKFTDFSMVGLTGDPYYYNGILAAYDDSNYWEPLDDVKGDTARIMMYMYMHYNDVDIKANSNFDLAGNMPITNVVYGGGSTQDAWDILLAWNALDPVDSFEARRNEECAKITGTRNPFIDYPEFADAIWGGGEAVNPDDNIGGGSGEVTPEEPSTPEIPETPVTPSEPSNPSVSLGEYGLVEDASDLVSGDKIIIAAKNANYALGTTQNKNNRAQSSITKNASTISFGGDTQIITLEAGTKANTFALNVGDGYLCSASSSSNHLKTETAITDASSWTISITNGSAKVVSQGTYSRNTIRYNSSASLFACYETGQEDVEIYKLCTKLDEPSIDDTNYNSEVNRLFTTYYNEGVYTKETNIYLNSEAQRDLITYFHASCNILERTTYYNKNHLWMSKENDTYSYYGTNNEGLTYATTDNPNLIPTDADVVVKNTTMLDYYITLANLKSNTAVWNKEGDVYYTTDEEVINYYLNFTAPCLLSSIFESDYFTYTKAIAFVEDSELVLQLQVDSDMYNALTNTDNVLSEARISISQQTLLESATDYINNLDQLEISSNYYLPTNFNGVNISWNGDNVDGNLLEYTSPDKDRYLFLTATLSIGALEREVEIQITELKYKEPSIDDGYEYTAFTSTELAIFNENLGYTIPFIPTDLYEVEVNTEFNAVNYYTYGNTVTDYNNYINILESNGFTSAGNYEYDGVTWYSYTKAGNYLDIAGYYTDELDPIYVIDIYLYINENGGDTPDIPEVPSNPGYTTLYFNDLANRVSVSGVKQVWTNGVVTLTNAGSCGDYYNPVRLYANSNVEISGENITSIVFSCAAKTSDKYYAEFLFDAISNYYDNVYMSNDTVTLTLDNPTDLVEFNIIKQTRLVSITVYFE